MNDLWPGWDEVCEDYLPWMNGGAPPPLPYPPDACGACGFSKTSHVKDGGLIEAAKELAEAKKAYAESFLLYRLKVPTDKQAEYRAEINCGERLILAQARYRIAERG